MTNTAPYISLVGNTALNTEDKNEVSPTRIRHPRAEIDQRIVVIIGAGFAGLRAAKELMNRKDVYVVLIDQRNYHLFQPLLYQVATAGLNPSEIAAPIRAQFAKAQNVSVYLGKVEEIQLQEKWVRANDVEFLYDYLIIACGSQHSYFNRPDWEEYAPGLKTLEQATEIRRRLLLAFELAENELDPQKQKSLLTFVVVGGGPTGVELAGAIADISRTVLVKDFKSINPASACVILVEGSTRILEAFDESLSRQAVEDLTGLGVEVRTSSRVDQITEEGVRIGENFIPSRSVFWAAGVRAISMNFVPGVELGREGKVKVSDDFSIPNFPHTFVVGDMAYKELKHKLMLPGVAPAAIQTGRYAARAIISRIKGRNPRKFRYFDKGLMATIGKNKAIVQAGWFRLHGRFAWILWLFVHILYLIGFKNRLIVITQWAWSYILSKRGARLITGKEWRIKKD